MKNRNYLIATLSIAIFFASCGQKRDTQENFGKFSLDLLLSEKSAQAIYTTPKDSILTNDTILIDWMRSLKDSIRYAEYLEKQETEIKEWRKMAIDFNLNNKQVEFLRTELDTIETLFSKRKDLKVYFLLDKKEHFFVLMDVDSLQNKWTAYSIAPPTNKEEQAKIELERRKAAALEPYTPWGIYFTGCNWEYKYARPETFTNFYVTLKNSTSNNFDKVKFRVKIYKNGSYGKTEVFSKVIEKSDKIYAGDVVRFEIFELRDFYVGINISNKDNFSWDAELVDAKPRPGYEDLPY